jgi:hypothetical protein
VADLALGTEGLWVAEPKQVRLVKPDETVVVVPGGFGRIEGMAADPSGGVVVADNNRVYRLRADGTREIMQMMGIAVAPLAGGALLDTIGDHHAAMWLAIAGIGVAQTACFALFVRRRRYKLAAAG